MNSTIHETLTKLELVAAQLDQASPSALEAIEALLAQRDAAVNRLQQLIRPEEGGLTTDNHKRLEAVQHSGQRLREKLLLAKAGLRDQMSGLYQTGQLLQALSTGQPGQPESPQLDYRG